MEEMGLTCLDLSSPFWSKELESVNVAGHWTLGQLHLREQVGPIVLAHKVLIVEFGAVD